MADEHAELLTGTFVLRLTADTYLVEADFVLVFRTAVGEQSWSFGFSHRDVVPPQQTLDPEADFRPFAESLFDDHIANMREEPALAPDRSFDELEIRFDLADDALAVLGY